MIYYKTSQPVPGKGDAWMYYECNDDQTIRRYLTYIPATDECDKVPNPFIKKLQRPEVLTASSKEEFDRYWPPEEGGLRPVAPPMGVQAEDGNGTGTASGVHFNADMTVVEAMDVHSQVAEVFAAFHLGGCASCGVGSFETVGQVCMAYGVDVDILLSVLDGLLEDKQPAESDKSAAVE